GPGGTGVQGVGIDPISVDPANPQCCQFKPGGGTNDAGDYSFAVRAGSYRIRFTPRSVLPLAWQYWNGAAYFAAATTITGVAGQTMTGLDAHFANGFVISGHVTDTETHLAVADVRVAARAGSPSEDFTVAAGSTDATGYYAFAVNAGTYELSVDGCNSDHPLVCYNDTPGGPTDSAAAH